MAQKEGEKEMKVLSLFSGVGGFDLGLERAGMETVFQCEWDKHATSILERHWPDTPRWTDVSTLTGAYVLQHAPIIDVVAWGSPCQDLSVAGKRAGLGGERSGLFHEGIRIIKEIREITNGQYPRFSIWENVAGALSSSNGADFGEVLYEMDEAGACFSEWRLLDAQYFGVPQRRRRVFVISVFDSATAARCPNPLLPVCEGVRGDIEAGGTEREEPTGTVEQSLASGSDIANTISAELYHRSTVVNQDVNNGHLVVGSLAARDYKGVGNQYVADNKCVVETFTKAKRAQTSTDDETWVGGDEPEASFVMRQREGKPGGGKGPLISEERSLTLKAGNDQTLFQPAAPMAVRRLTPLECERLMGWPDDWTRWRADGKEQKDSHRYKQCGNGVASPVTEWIGGIIVRLLGGVA